LLGGVFGIICMAVFFRGEESAIAVMGVYLLISVMFFALAGGFAKDGQWSWDMMLLMTFLTIGATVCSAIIGLSDIYAAAALIVLGALIVVVLISPASKTWMNRVRI